MFFSSAGSDQISKRWHGRTRWAATFFAALLTGAYGVAAEPKAGDLITIEVPGRAGKVSLKFRYCPPGEIRPGPPETTGENSAQNRKPKVASNGLGALLHGPTRLKAFYMADAEITIPQFRGLLGDVRFQAVVDRFPSLQSAKNLKSFAAKGGEYPIFSVTLEDTAEFCEALRAAYTARPESAVDGIIAYQFRLPTHAEWQYACRAQAGPKSESLYPHFSGWPDGVEALDRNTISRWTEEWEKLGKDGRSYRGTQNEAVSLVEKSREGNNVPLEILSAFLKAGIGVERNYAENRLGRIAPVRTASRPNAWGVYDMHENVHEWVVAAPPDRADALSRQMLKGSALSESDRSDKILLYAGGAFNALMFGSPHGWMTFTIWGGKPVNAQGLPVAFSLSDEGPSHAKTQEYDPGFRIVMQRSLSQDWLLALREEAVLAAKVTPDVLDRLSTKHAAASDVATPRQVRELNARFSYYEGLARYRMGEIAEASKKVRASAQTNAGAPREQSAQLLGAISLGSGSEPGTPAAPAISDDELFLTTLAALIERDK